MKFQSRGFGMLGILISEVHNNFQFVGGGGDSRLLISKVSIRGGGGGIPRQLRFAVPKNSR